MTNSNEINAMELQINVIKMGNTPCKPQAKGKQEGDNNTGNIERSKKQQRRSLYSVKEPIPQINVFNGGWQKSLCPYLLQLPVWRQKDHWSLLMI